MPACSHDLALYHGITSRHWLVDSFVLFGAPYMLYDISAMYLTHYHQHRLGTSAVHQNHSLQTVKVFLRKEWLLVLHHMALLLVFMPIVLVRDVVEPSSIMKLKLVKMLYVHYRYMHVDA